MEIWWLKFNWLSNVTTRRFSNLVLEILFSLIVASNLSFLLKSNWKLSGLSFNPLFSNHSTIDFEGFSNWLITFSGVYPMPYCVLSLQEKPYFPGPGISWKAKKDQVNIIFTAIFWLKKDRISHHRKVQNKNFSVISKYHLSINFLSQRRPYFPFPKSSKQELPSTQ